MVSLVDKEKWAPLIGRLFISFGSIESVTHDCIRQFSSDVIHKNIKRMPLSRRIDLAIDLVASQPFSEANKSVFVADFRKAQELADRRNIIAHSPLSLVLFREEPDAPMREAIASNTDDERFIEFGELQEAVEQSEAIAEKIHHNMAAFRLEGIELSTFPANWKGLGGV